MITRLQQRAAQHRYELERELAPHVEPGWAETFLLELRLQGVGGPDIGHAIAEVESHCAESGESATAAFGDPAAYARALELPRAEAQSPRAVLRTLVPGAVSLVGIMLAVTATPAVATGRPFGLTWGTLAALALGVGAVLATVRHLDPVLRTVLARPVRAWFVAMAGIAVVVSPQLALGTREAVVLPALPVLLVGSLAVLAVAAWNLRPGELADDPVTPPLAEQARPPRRRGAALVATLSAPVGTAVLVAVSWWAATR
ncbi:hypothetical protein [Puerhibacterium sp. TATVAM-FAB25]|uniref:hypothetical protein n=1 Tax=Puerhibacterium sp. TATVAM-FAB25 TaxID=3093699 RepID=UPI0039796FAB